MNQPLPRRTALRAAAVLVVGSVAATTTACTSDSSGGSDDGDPDAGSTSLVVAADQRAGVVDVDASPHEQALAASRVLLDRAGVVVVASADTDVAAAAELATAHALPVLVAGPGLAAELDRLGVSTVVRVGTGAPEGVDASAGLVVVDGSDAGAVAALPGLPPRPKAHGAVVLLRPGGALPPAVA
ncbi:MAG TPA: hypothetical protein PLD94_00095, partial [Ornithinibacter sp.]|nr:hypothetical protein [Ornithinibacter sp.]